MAEFTAGNENPDYGPRLSGAEYDRKIVELHRGLPPIPSREQDERVCRQELNLTIDYRLGCEFPSERRDALWEVWRKLERHRLRTAVTGVIGRLVPNFLTGRARRLAGSSVAEYAKVLSEAELRRFLDLDDPDAAAFPVDLERSRKQGNSE